MIDEPPTMVLGIDPGVREMGWCLLDFAVRSSPVFFDGGKVTVPLALFDYLAHEGLAKRIGLVAVEQPRGYVPIERVNAVLGTTWGGGRMAGIAEARGFPVVAIGVNEWRVAFIGRLGPGEDGDTKVALVLRQFVRHWPERSAVHVRDAGGVACIGARQAFRASPNRVYDPGYPARERRGRARSVSRKF